jgi:muconolactone delta-isomerase
MKIFAIEKNIGERDERFTPYLKAEAARVWELYQDGMIREIYFRTDEAVAVLVLECDDAAEAKALLDTLPLVQQKLIKFEILPLKPYPGFLRLFAEKG